MLVLDIPSQEFYKEDTMEFITIKGYELRLEHSLHSIFNWEGIWKKPFLTEEGKTKAEWLSYLDCMCLNDDKTNIDYRIIQQDKFKAIQEYINDTKTATFFANRRSEPQTFRRETLTAELIFYYMIEFDIPMECQYWHLSRLLTLIRICGIRRNADQKMSKHDVLKQNAAINAARRAKRH